MENLRRHELVGPLKDYIASGRPFLGVCMGQQALFDLSEEGGEHECLGILPGRVVKLPAGQKVPHIGWNQVRFVQQHPLFAGIPDRSYFYFVHSYYPQPEDASLVAGETEYGVTSPPVVYRDLVITGAEVPEYPSKGPSGMVRAFNIRSGKLVWTFHTIPQPGETGHETWQSDSWKGRTGANVWSVMSVDAERGLVFLPIGSASYDFYAPTVKVRTCSPIVWSRWTRPPANWFGTSRPCTTISGITICRRSPCSSMWGGMAAKFPRWLRSRRWVSYLFSTGLRESHCFR